MHLRVGDIKPPPSVWPPQYPPKRVQGGKGSGGLMDSPRIAQSGFNLRGFPKLFDSLNGVSVITPKYTLALPGGVRGVRGTFHHPPQQLYHRGTLASNQNQAIKEKNISLYCQIKRVHSLSCRWLPGNFSMAQSCAACSMGINGCLVAQCTLYFICKLQACGVSINSMVTNQSPSED